MGVARVNARGRARACGRAYPRRGPMIEGRMVKLDHLTIRVRDLRATRDWFVTTLELRVEFEVPGRATVALQDDAGLTLFLEETAADVAADGRVITLQVDDAEATNRELWRAGVPF